MNGEIHWWNAAFGEEEKLELGRVLESNYLNEGPKTREFEARLRGMLGSPHVHAVPNGTTALALSLWALGVGHGDEVLVPDLTFIATANAVHMVGARPVPVDVGEDFQMDIGKAWRRLTPRTKALIAVHVNGRPADLDALADFRCRSGLPVIEDAAQALGSRRDGRHLGTFFDFGCVSLAPSKVISTGQGGLVLTASGEHSYKITRLKDHGRMSRAEETHPQPGYNFKFTDLQAAVGLRQLDKLAAHNKKAVEDARFYAGELAGLRGFRTMPFDFGRGTVPLWIDAMADDRAALFAHLKARRIFPRPFWGALHRQWLGGDDRDFPGACRAADHGLWLPSGPVARREDLEAVVRAVRESCA